MENIKKQKHGIKKKVKGKVESERQKEEGGRRLPKKLYHKHFHEKIK